MSCFPASVVLINVNVGRCNDDVKPGVRVPSRMRQPLDLAYCAAVLEEAGHACRIIDALALNLSADDVAGQCDADRVVLNTSPLDRWECPYLSLDRHVQQARAIRRRSKAALAFIGPHGTVTPQDVFDRAGDAVDAVVMGEPEQTVLEWVEGKPLAGIAGLAWRDNGVVRVNPARPLIDPLDKLPFPAYHLLPMERYHDRLLDDVRPFALMVTSRGCPFPCTFCLKKMWGPTYRTHSVARVLDDVERIQREHGVKAVYFQDLEFALDRKRLAGICEGLIERNVGLRWGCSARFNDVDEEILALMKKAGCEQITFGLESASPEVLKRARKGLEPADAARTLEAVRRIGIRPYVVFILGLPGETRETLRETVRFAVDHDLRFTGAALCIPYPGTALWDGRWSWEEAGRLAGTVGTDILMGTTEKALLRFVRYTYYRTRYSPLFFFHPGFIRDALSRVAARLKTRV